MNSDTVKLAVTPSGGYNASDTFTTAFSQCAGGAEIGSVASANMANGATYIHTHNNAFGRKVCTRYIPETYQYTDNSITTDTGHDKIIPVVFSNA